MCVCVCVFVCLQGQSGTELVVPDEYQEGLRRRLAATGAPLEEAVRDLFRGRDFYAGLRGMPGHLEHIRATLVSDGFFGCFPSRDIYYIYIYIYIYNTSSAHDTNLPLIPPLHLLCLLAYDAACAARVSGRRRASTGTWRGG